MKEFEVGETFDLLALPEEEIAAWLGDGFVDVLRRWRDEGSKGVSARVVSIDGTSLTLDVIQPGRIGPFKTTIGIWAEEGAVKQWAICESFDRPLRPRGRIGPLTEAWRRIRDEEPEEP